MSKETKAKKEIDTVPYAKIKYVEKPLTRKQRWNIFVTLAPWLILTIIAFTTVGTQIGIMWEKNRVNDITAAKAEATAQLKAEQ